MGAISVTIKGVENLGKWATGIPERVAVETRKAIARGAVAIQKTAVQSIQGGGKHGTLSLRGKRKNKTHVASAPGEAPAADTGVLASNIVLVREDDGNSILVVSRAKYSKALEFGTSRMAARPFMQPAAEANKHAILADLNGAVARALK